MLEAKRIIVTGAGQGIGAAIASCCQEKGAVVYRVDLNRGADVEGHHDVADEASVAAMVDGALEHMGGIDGLVNNVGVPGPTGAVEELGPADFDECVRINVGGTFRATSAVVPHLERGDGIVNIASTAGLFGYPLRSPYAASKWAVVGLTKTWAMELGERGIRVNAIAPGTVDNDRMNAVMEREAAATGVSVDDIRAGYTNQVSMRTLVTGDDIGRAAAWLLSAEARYVNGEVLCVDGHTETLRTT